MSEPMKTAYSHPTISIIVPIYNSELYLDQCLTSITRQTYPHYEVILVDDGSQDKSNDICKQFCGIDSRFRLISQPNEGVDKARNTGLKVANGEYITFMDSDDWVEEHWLQAYVDTLNVYPFDLLVQGIVVDYMTSIRRETLPEKRYQGKSVIEGIMELEKKHLSGFAHNKMYRATLISQQQLTFEFTFKEDLLFNLRYNLFIDSMAIIEKAIYHYVQREGPSLIKKRYPPHQMFWLITSLKEAGLALAGRYQSTEYTLFTWQRYLSEYTIQIAGLYNQRHGVVNRKRRIAFIEAYQQEAAKMPTAKPQFQNRMQAIYAKMTLLPPPLCDCIFTLLFGIINRMKK